MLKKSGLLLDFWKIVHKGNLLHRYVQNALFTHTNENVDVVENLKVRKIARCYFCLFHLFTSSW